MNDHFSTWLFQWNNPFLWFGILAVCKWLLETLPGVAPRWNVYWSPNNKSEVAEWPRKTRITFHIIAAIFVIAAIYMMFLWFQFVTSCHVKVK